MKHATTRTDILEIIDTIADVRDRFAGKTVLLTGSGGFLGRYFTQVFTELNAVLETPCRLIAVDNFITGRLVGAPEDSATYRFEQRDVIEPFDPGERVDFIVHAAGIASPFYYRAHPLETLDVAIQGTRHMLELAKANDARLVFFSSSEIYGDPDPANVPTPETYKGNVACQGPRACYDESKRVGETLCYIYHQSHGVQTNTIRPFNVYGPGMGERDKRVLPNFANQIKGGRPLKVYGSGVQTRTYCYITDAMNGFLRVIATGTPGEAYNIGNPTPEVSVMDLVAATREAVDGEVLAEVVDYPDSYPADEPQRRCPDIAKARTDLGYAPKVDLVEGLRRFYAWADENYTGEP